MLQPKCVTACAGTLLVQQILQSYPIPLKFEHNQKFTYTEMGRVSVLKIHRTSINQMIDLSGGAIYTYRELLIQLNDFMHTFTRYPVSYFFI